MDKTLSFILTVIIVITLGILSVLYFAFGDHKELDRLKNPVNNEEIYLIKVSWGLEDYRMAISLNRKLKGGFSNNFDDKYLLDYGDHIFYKFSNDTLLIYGSEFDKPKVNNFMTPIKFITLENPEFIRLGENGHYKKYGLNIFPESVLE